MKIDLNNLREVYGDEILDIINDNMDIIEENIKTMRELGFDDVEGILERNIDAFLYFPKNFKEKMQKLIQSIGANYVEIIENDVNYMKDL